MPSAHTVYRKWVDLSGAKEQSGDHAAHRVSLMIACSLAASWC